MSFNNLSTFQPAGFAFNMLEVKKENFARFCHHQKFLKQMDKKPEKLGAPFGLGQRDFDTERQITQ